MDEKTEAKYRRTMGRAMALFDNPTDEVCIAASVGFSTACTVFGIPPSLAAQMLRKYVSEIPPGDTPPSPSLSVAKGYDLQVAEVMREGHAVQ